MTTAIIDQSHIDQMNRICRLMVYRSPDSHLMPSVDELQSQGLVILWDLALSWNEAKCPFSAYIQLFMKRRLIDYMRTVNGRTDANNGHDKAQFNTKINPTDFSDPVNTGIRTRSPSPARIVTGIDSLERVMTIVNEVCTERQKDALLWPLFAENSDEVCKKWNMTRNTADAHRFQAKERVYKALNKRPFPKQSRGPKRKSDAVDHG